jgi:hypothetical protein
MLAHCLPHPQCFRQMNIFICINIYMYKYTIFTHTHTHTHTVWLHLVSNATGGCEEGRGMHGTCMLIPRGVCTNRQNTHIQQDASQMLVGAPHRIRAQWHMRTHFLSLTKDKIFHSLLPSHHSYVPVSSTFVLPLSLSLSLSLSFCDVLPLIPSSPQPTVAIRLTCFHQATPTTPR